MRKKTLIQSIDRAIDVLEIVRDAEGAIRSTSISREMNLPLKTVHNIIRSLYEHGYLAQNREKNYQLGVECFRMADQAKGPFFELGRAVGKPVRHLQELTGDTAFFGCEYSGCLYCVSVAYASGYWEVNGHQPWLDALHATSAGHILLAEKNLEKLQAFFADRTLKEFTPSTRTALAQLEPELEKCRLQNYSLVADEHVQGNTSLAVPVRSLGGELLGALVSSFPSASLEDGKLDLKTRLQLLRQTAGEIINAGQHYI